MTQRIDACAKPTEGGTVGVLPAFYSQTYSLRYGVDAIEVYHDRSECHIGRLILEDHNEAFGEGGRASARSVASTGRSERVSRN